MKILCLTALLLVALFQYVHSQDSVSVTFQVVVPEGTPEKDHIFWVGSLNNWDPGDEGFGFGVKEYGRRATLENEVWSITLKAERGSKQKYKYTRGSIYSTEEQIDFTFRPLRTVIFDKPKIVRDSVEAWRDIPPESLANSWPKIELRKTDLNFAYNEIPLPGSGTILYDKEMGSRFYDFDDNRTVESIPGNFYDAVHYYKKISSTSEDFILISAAKLQAEGPWHIFLDLDGNNSIEMSERIFIIQKEKEVQEWSGMIPFRKVDNNKSYTDSVKLILRHITDLPDGYSSSVNPDAPDLMYLLPFKHRTGSINGQSFNITTSFEHNFRAYNQITIDRDSNDTLNIGSGSNEVYSSDFNQMRQQQNYFQFPSFKLGNEHWELVDVDINGEWVRLRHAENIEDKQEIARGKIIPDWEAVTVQGDTLSSTSMRGKYLFLDFWGSWCGPCIEALPLLKDVYQHFQSENFEMVGFAYESRASLDKALEKYRLPWPQVLDEKGTYKTRFLVQGYPTHYLIGPEGKVLAMGEELRGKKLIKTLEKYLDK